MTPDKVTAILNLCDALAATSPSGRPERFALAFLDDHDIPLFLLRLPLRRTGTPLPRPFIELLHGFASPELAVQILFRAGFSTLDLSAILSRQESEIVDLLHGSQP